MLATLSRSIAGALVLLTLLAEAATPVFGQAQPAQRSPLPAQAAARPAAQAGLEQTPPQLAVPDTNKLAILIHTSLIALNQANLTGNYSVLRELGAPGFQLANSPAKLADIFGHLRRQRLDLSPIVLFTPNLVRHPAIDARGLLTLSGFFDTQPQRVEFDLLFQPVGGEWRLFGIRAATANPPTADASNGGPTQQAATRAAAAQAAPAKNAQPALGAKQVTSGFAAAANGPRRHAAIRRQANSAPSPDAEPAAASVQAWPEAAIAREQNDEAPKIEADPRLDLWGTSSR